MRARALLAALLLSLGGCRLFRAEVGLGLGLGAEVHLSGLVHTGALATAYAGLGVLYHRPSAGLPFGFVGLSSVTLPFFHWSGLSLPIGPAYRTLTVHSNLGLLPPLTAGVAGEKRGRWRPVWAFEVSVAALFVTVRLGFDPIGALIDLISPLPATEAAPSIRESLPAPWTEPTLPLSSRPPPPGPTAFELDPPTPAERAEAARAFLSHAVGLYAAWGHPALDEAWSLRRAELRREIWFAIATSERQGNRVGFSDLSRWAIDGLWYADWCVPVTEADRVARELVSRR